MQNTHIIKIGLDVATKSTGCAIFNGDKLSYAGRFITGDDATKFKGDKISQDAISIQGLLEKNVVLPIQRIINANKWYGKDEKGNLKVNPIVKVIVALEMSNHANRMLGQKLSVFVGMYAAILSVQLGFIGISFIRDNLEIKLINPREWMLRAYGTTNDREIGKEASIIRANKYIEKEDQKLTSDMIGKGGDDIADAINIASLTHVVRDNFFVGQEKHIREKKEASNKGKIAKLTIDRTKLYDKLREKQQKQVFKTLSMKKKDKELAAKELSEKPIIYFANAAELERLARYDEELKKLNVDLTKLHNFAVKGETNETNN